MLTFLVVALSEGFALYNVALGDYPGIIHSNQRDKVKGEIYEVDAEILKRLDDLEDEGILYLRKLTTVMVDGKAVDNVYIYVYNQGVTKKDRVEFKDQPWKWDK